MALNNAWMRGPYTARHGLIDYLQANLNSQLAVLRTQWGVNQDELPDVVEFDPYKQYALDIDSMIEVEIPRITDFAPTDYDATIETQIRSRNNVRLYSWVKNTGYEETLQNRDMVAVAVRILLLKSPSLGDSNRFALNLRSLTEDYSDAVKAKGDRWVAGVIHSFELQVDEGLVGSYYGDPAPGQKTLKLEVDKLPPAEYIHPGLR